MTGSTDFELLDAWGDGDSAAGIVLFDRHFDTLHRFFDDKVEHCVEDLLQWTLLACVQSRGRARRDSSFRSYLFQVARFQLHAHYRGRNESLLDFSVVAAADFATSASHTTGRKGARQVMSEALPRTPLDCHIALELSFRECLSGAEIAVVLGVREASVQTRLRRATERLRCELENLTGRELTTYETRAELQRWAMLPAGDVQDQKGG